MAFLFWRVVSDQNLQNLQNFQNEEINLMLRILKFLSGTRRVDAPARFLVQITERRNARIVFSISLSV